VTWQHDGQNVTGFDILRDTTSSLQVQAAAKVGEVGPEARSYRDDTAQMGSYYRYSVVAKNASGASSAAAQSGEAVSPGPHYDIVMGTFNVAPLGTVWTTMLSFYDFPERPEETSAGTLRGPAGWNGGAEYANRTAPNLIERGWGRLHTSVAAVSGSYESSITVSGETYTASAGLDASQVLPAPQNITVTASSATSVTATWDAVAGALSYQAYIRENPNVFTSTTLGSVFVATPGATLDGLELPAGEYQLEVQAFTVDLSSGQRPGKPAQYNVSYDRSAPFSVE
jgi:hypothetical protein